MENRMFWLLLLFQEPNVELFALQWDQGARAARVESLRRLTFSPGYDNQPSFADDWVLFSSDGGSGKTDIHAIHPASGQRNQMTHTPKTGEYSPQQQPGGSRIWFVRVEEDERQRIWSCRPNGRGLRPEFAEWQGVGYFLPLGRKSAVAFFLGDPPQLARIEGRNKVPLARDVLRGLQGSPLGDEFAYAQRDGEAATIFRMTEKGLPSIWAPLPEKCQDFLWMRDGSLLVGRGEELLIWNDKMGWRLAGSLADKGLRSISRLAQSQDGHTLVLVAEVPEGS
jgi:hypothetical protein